MKYILPVLLTALLIQPGSAQTFRSNVTKRGTTAAAFLSICQGARALSMGSAYVAVADDPSSLYWNPAGITDIYGGSLVVDHSQWLAGINYNFVAGTYNLGDFGVLGMSFTSSDIDEMLVRTVENPEGNGETFAVSDVAFSIAYALRLTDKFSIGFNPKVIHQKIWNMSADAVAIDIGIKYITPFDGIVLGMSISNFGSKMQMAGSSSNVLYDPDPATVGNNGRIPANLSMEEWSLPLNFKFGLAYKVLNDNVNKLMISVDAAHPSDNYESVDFGAEYIFNDFLALRGGYKSLNDLASSLLSGPDYFSDWQDEEKGGLSLGIGVKQSVVGNVQCSFDYAYQDFGRLLNVQKFSVGILF